MGSSKLAGVLRFRIDPEKIGSALNFLMHYDGLRFIDVTLIGALDVLIKNFFFIALSNFCKVEHFLKKYAQIRSIMQSQLFFRSEFQSEFLKNRWSSAFTNKIS